MPEVPPITVTFPPDSKADDCRAAAKLILDATKGTRPLLAWFDEIKVAVLANGQAPQGSMVLWLWLDGPPMEQLVTNLEACGAIVK